MMPLVDNQCSGKTDGTKLLMIKIRKNGLTISPLASDTRKWDWWSDDKTKLFLISNFRRDFNIVYVLLGISPASNCSWPTFRNPVSVPYSKAVCRVYSTTSLWRWNWYRVPKRRPTTIWRRGNTRVATLIVETIYLQLIQNRYMFRSFTVLQCSHQHCVQPVASDVKVVGYL